MKLLEEDEKGLNIFLRFTNKEDCSKCSFNRCPDRKKIKKRRKEIDRQGWVMFIDLLHDHIVVTCSNLDKKTIRKKDDNKEVENAILKNISKIKSLKSREAIKEILKEKVEGAIGEVNVQPFRISFINKIKEEYNETYKETNDKENS